MVANTSENDLLRIFLLTLMKLENVERGSIWVKKGSQYECIEATGDQSARIKGLKINSDKPSIVKWVIENGQMTIARPGDDRRHFSEIESGLKVKSTMILCFPLIMKDGNVYGALQLIDTSVRGRNINLKQEYLELIENLVNIGAIALNNFFDYHFQLSENEKLNQAINQLKSENPIIGQNAKFLEVLEKAREYARADYPVLILGESGTGKEIFAREIYRLCKRNQRPYYVRNCSAIPDTLLESELFGHKRGAFTGATADKKGVFEAADTGVIFLDEIGDMPLNLQARILRVIQNGEIKPLGSTETKVVDVRIISATNMDLTRAIQKQAFREDLFYRLNVLPVHIPPLRERRDDIPLLIEYFLNRECHRSGIPYKKLSQEALNALVNYSWKGNVRELENFVRHIIVVTKGTVIELTGLPEHIRSCYRAAVDTKREPVDRVLPAAEIRTDTPSARLEAYTWIELERAYMMRLLETCRWNITRAARQAGVNRSTFNSRMRKLGIRK